MRTVCLILFFAIIPIRSSAVVLRTAFQLSPPKYYKDGEQVKGICFDILVELNRRLTDDDVQIDIQPQRVPFRPLEKLQADLEAGVIDVFVGMARTDAREETYQYIETPVYEVYSTFARSATDTFDYRGPGSLRGKRIAFLEGTKTGRQITAVAGVVGVSTPRISIAMQMLADGKVDLVFYQHLGLLYTAKLLNLLDDIELTTHHAERYGHYIALNKNVPAEVVAAIENDLKAMIDDQTIDRIINRYLSKTEALPE